MRVILFSLLFVVLAFSSTSFARHYNHGGEVYYQEGYYKPSSGTWVEGHYKTRPDEHKWNNLSYDD